MMYAEVILPLPISTTFTYSIPHELSTTVKPGMRVIVPFGRKKFYTGIVAMVSPMTPRDYEVKDITMLIDDEPILRHPQLKLWRWVADYYLCSIGDVYKAGVPAGLKIESETFIEINPEYEEISESPLSEREAIVCQYLDHEGKRLRISDIEKNTGLRNINSTVSRLLEKGAVIISERLVERYRPKMEVYVKPEFNVTDSSAAFETVKGAPKQEAALLALIELSNIARGGSIKEVPRKELMERADVSSPIINAMEKKGVLSLYRKEINRFKYQGLPDRNLPTLNQAQSRALDEIHRLWIEKGVTLLHGVTSSGKTEIYIHLIDWVMKQRRQVLFLVPEIALTTQLTHRLQQVFGEKVLIYHSKFSDNERVDLWRRLRKMNGEPCVVIGARSSVFLPFDHLGLVIVDEEHEQSYKQSEPAPRYNGRDTAIMLAQMHGAKTLLGSATPAVDTYYKAKSGRYGLMTLNERYGDMPLPEIEFIDIKQYKKEAGATSALAPLTRSHITRALDDGKQAIVFINRRGYAPMAVCNTCGYTPKCTNCDVSLTYHRLGDRLVCHYCGATYPCPTVCPACHEHDIEIVGHGTERVEEELALHYPDTGIARMDLDSTRSKEAYSTIIDEFSRGKKQLLVGTQMVTKGLDFDNVKTVAVVNADAVLHYPDFRATERAFSMIEQVAGRAGRRVPDSIVAVQTMQPDHQVYDLIKKHDYNAFYEMEIEERKRYLYPPFTRLIYIYLKHADPHALNDIAAHYATHLRGLFGNRVYGPEEPLVGRIQSLYIRKIMLKFELTVSMPKVKQLLREARELMFKYPMMKATTLYYDVDPM